MAFTDWIGGALGGAASGAIAGNMVAPGIGAVVGALAGGALGGWAASEAAARSRGATDAEVAQLKAIFDRVDKEWATPQYDETARITPEEYKLVGNYIPEFAQFVEENKPQLISQSVSSQERQAQRNALEQYRQMGQTGQDAIAKAAEEHAAFQANAAERQKRLQIMQQATQRGLGPESMVGAELAGAQQASDQQRQAALDAEAQAQQRRIQALQQYSQLATNMQQQNLTTEAKNADIINQFNERLTRSRNDYNQYRANLANQAQQQNLNYLRQTAQANTGLQNQAQAMNLQRQDTIASEKARMANEKLKALVGQGTDIAKTQGQAGRDAAKRFGEGVSAGVSTLPGLFGAFAPAPKSPLDVTPATPAAQALDVSAPLSASKKYNLGLSS